MPIGRDERKGVLAGIEVFASLDERDIDRLIDITTTRQVKKRDVLFRKGEAGSQLYAVMEGRLRATGEGLDGKEVVFNFMEPGEVIGEIAILDQQIRSATVQAVEDSTLLSLHRRDLIPFLEKHPKVAIHLAQVLAARIRRLSETMEDTLFLGLPSRLAKRLIGLAATYGQPEGDGVKIDLKLPQQQLGELVGTSRESINKQLRLWTDEGLVRFEKGFVTILNEEGLDDIASLLVS